MTTTEILSGECRYTPGAIRLLMVLLTNKTPSILRVQRQELVSVQRKHGRPVGARSACDGRSTPAASPGTAGNNLHFTTVDSRRVCILIRHKRRHEGASNVDNVWCTSLAGRSVNAGARVPCAAVVLRKDGIDGEAANLCVFKDATKEREYKIRGRNAFTR